MRPTSAWTCARSRWNASTCARIPAPRRFSWARPKKNSTGQIYSSGSDLSVVLPARVFAWVRLLNPFCRVDYPQGDLEKREDGSLVTPTAGDAQGTVEIAVDGPIHNLVLDVEDAVLDG